MFFILFIWLCALSLQLGHVSSENQNALWKSVSIFEDLMIALVAIRDDVWLGIDCKTSVPVQPGPAEAGHLHNPVIFFYCSYPKFPVHGQEAGRCLVKTNHGMCVNE